MSSARGYLFLLIGFLAILPGCRAINSPEATSQKEMCALSPTEMSLLLSALKLIRLVPFG